MRAAIYLVPTKPPVSSPNKPGKVRTVANSASTCKGVLLNSCLEIEPDLLNNMFGLLINFRKKSVAVSAVLEDMLIGNKEDDGCKTYSMVQNVGSLLPY